jgi:hypothetical protein
VKFRTLDVELALTQTANELPAVFCDRADIGALEGTGEAVFITFSSPYPRADGVGATPVFRVAMTRLAFSMLAKLMVETDAQISAPPTGKAN